VDVQIMGEMCNLDQDMFRLWRRRVVWVSKRSNLGKNV